MLSGVLRAPMQPRGPAGVDQQHIRPARGNVACTRQRMATQQTSICRPAVAAAAAEVAAPPPGSALRVFFAPEDSSNALHLQLGGERRHLAVSIRRLTAATAPFFFLRHRVVKLPDKVSVTV